MNRDAAQLVWARLADAEGRLGALEAALPEPERARAARFRVADARGRFVLGRTLLRRAVGQLLGVPAEELALVVDERGKPHLADPAEEPGPFFNLSHSGPVVAVAVASVAVGVDVESLRPVVSAERLARRFLSAAEAAAVLAADAAERDRAFLRIWTQKEAYLKATGLGVGMPLREVDTEPDPARPPRLLAIAGDRAEAAHWTLLEADIPDAVCTVAVLGEPPDLIVRRVTPQALSG
jgi:4'-phosphopantetheinyl transferase